MEDKKQKFFPQNPSEAYFKGFRQFIFMVLLLPIPLLVFAQAKVTYGKPFRTSTVSETPLEENKFFLQKDSFIVSLKKSGNFIYVEKLSSKGLSLSKFHIYEDLPKNFHIVKVIRLNGGAWCFYSAQDRKTGFRRLFKREINMDEALFAGEGEILVDLQEKYPLLTHRNLFRINSSIDGKKLIVSYPLKPVKDKEGIEHVVLGFTVFNRKLVPLVNQKITLNDNAQDVAHWEFSVDGAGNAYLLCNVFDVKWKGKINYMRSEKSTYHYEVTTIPLKSSEGTVSTVIIKDSAISVGGWVQRAALFERYPDGMICSGFYSKDKSSNLTDGIFMVQIDGNGKTGEIHKTQIPESIRNLYSRINPICDNRMYEKDLEELSYLVLTDLIAKPDGSFLVVGEQQYMIAGSFISPARDRVRSVSRRTLPAFHYNDLLVCKFDSSMNLLWMEKIPKSQKCIKVGGVMSYQHLATAGKHYFFIAENDKNKTCEPGYSPVNCTEETATMLSVWIVDDATGKSVKEPLLLAKNILDLASYPLYPQRVFAISPQELLTEIGRKNESQLVKIEFNQP